MPRKKKPDKLSQEVSMALAAGMSYGKWKAMQSPVISEKKIPDGWLVCEWCGKQFKPKTSRPQKFCDVGCQQHAYYEKNKQKCAAYMRKYREAKEADKMMDTLKKEELC